MIGSLSGGGIVLLPLLMGLLTAADPVYMFQFEEQISDINPFNGVNVGSLAAPTCADLDGDGDIDCLVGNALGELRYYLNTGSSMSAIFTEQVGVTHPFVGAVDVGEGSHPVFVDLDEDGDFDCLIGETTSFSPSIRYFKNLGTMGASIYQEQTGGSNPFTEALTPSSRTLPSWSITCVSIGCFVGQTAAGPNSPGFVRYYQRSGPAATPVFTQTAGSNSPFNTSLAGPLEPVVTMNTEQMHVVAVGNTPSCLDTPDTSGTSIICVSGAIDGTVKYFTNFTRSQESQFIHIDVGSSSSPVLVDIDGDGDLDLFIGAEDGTVRYFRNSGNCSAGSGFVSPASCMTCPGGKFVGSAVCTECPAGKYQGNQASLSCNACQVGYTTPSAGSTSTVDCELEVVLFSANWTASEFPSVDTADFGSHAAPFLVDLDGDMKVDVVIASLGMFGIPNTAKFFKNTGSSTEPVFTEQTGDANPFAGFTGLAKVSLHDINDDGLVDLLATNYNQQTISYYKNTGTTTVPQFVLQDPSDNPWAAVQSNSPPVCSADLDTGTPGIVCIVAANPNPRYFTSRIVANSHVFVEKTGDANPANGVLVTTSALWLEDIDGDGLVDLISSGTEHFSIYKNTGSAAAPEFELQAGTDSTQYLQQLRAPGETYAVMLDAKVTLKDIDSDGDPDLVIGSRSGINYFFLEHRGVPSRCWAGCCSWGMCAVPRGKIPVFPIRSCLCIVPRWHCRQWVRGGGVSLFFLCNLWSRAVLKQPICHLH
jgi:hypothetical protein